MRRLTLLLALASVAIPATAQDTAFSAALSDSVVVSASRLPEGVRETGRRVIVLTAQDIQALPATSFDELLRNVGGVEIQSRGGFGVQSDITMRGSSFDGVVVLLDGARLNDPQTGHFLTNFPVPLSEIARIEVVRGPATALYGPDAVGGVIHLFTWSGLQQLDPAPTVDAEVQAGQHGFYSIDGAVRYPVGRTSLSMSAAANGADGELILDSGGSPIQSSTGVLRTDFRRRVYSVAASRSTHPAALYARAGYDTRDFGSWHFYTPFESDTARSDSRTAWAQVRLQTLDPGSATRASLQISARWQESSYQYNPVSAANSHTNHVATVQTEIIHHFRPRVSVAGGVTASVRGIDSNSMGVHDDGGGGVFALARWKPAEALTFNASSRLDYDPAFGTEATPQLGIAYNRGAIGLRAAAARAVRAPSYTERYYDTERANPSGNLGNPSLRAERAWTYEAGGDIYLGDGSIHTTVFRRTAHDLIDYARVDGENPLFVARNILSVRTTGLEIDGEIHRWVGETRFRGTVSYSLLNSRLEVPPGVSYKYALTHARQIGQASAMASHGRLSLGTRALWKDPMEGSSYGILDARAAVKLPFSGARVSATAEVRNVFDREYAEVFDAPMPGRWWIFGLSVR